MGSPITKRPKSNASDSNPDEDELRFPRVCSCLAPAVIMSLTASRIRAQRCVVGHSTTAVNIFPLSQRPHFWHVHGGKDAVNLQGDRHGWHDAKDFGPITAG